MTKSPWRTLIASATIFLSSGCVVILAMVVFRMAAAELGTSPYIWTAVLAVTLAGLALGGFLGGRIADRFHSRRTLSVLFALASAACVLVVVLNNALRDWTGLWGLYWPLHVSLHVGLLLLLPVTLLAATAPVAGKMASGDGITAGRVVGTIFAWGACGSIAAVVLAEFFLIPAYGNAATVWSVSVAMLVLAFLYWISCWVLYVWGMVFGVVLLLATSSAPWAGQSGTAACLRTARTPNVLYEKQTFLGSVVVEQVSQRPDVRVLRLDGNEQGTTYLSDATYVQGFPAAVGAAVMRRLWQTGGSPSVLFLGSGGYVLPRYAKAVWPQSTIRVVEPDRGVTAAATAVLGLASAAIETVHADAEAYLSILRRQQKRTGSPQQCDLIYAQFSNPFDVPFCLVTKQFNDGFASLLSENGVYVLSIVDLAKEGRFLGAVVNTLAQTFRYVQVIGRAADRPAAVEDFTVIAGQRPLALAETLTSDPLCPAARVLDAAEVDRLKKCCSGIILTNERAPVGAFQAPAVRAHASLQLARKRFEQAVSLEKQGQDERSDALYRQVASADTPCRADAYAAVGRRCLTKSDVRGAADAFDAALKCAAENGAAAATVAGMHAELAGALRKMNRLPLAGQHMAAAIQGFQTEVRQHPKSVVDWERLGDAFVFQEDWPNASDAFSRCVDLEPDYLTHYDKLATTLEKQRRYEEAVKVVRAQIVLLKKTGRKEAVAQQSQYAEFLEYQRVKQPR